MKYSKRSFLLKFFKSQLTKRQKAIFPQEGNLKQWLHNLNISQKIAYGYGLALSIAVVGTALGLMIGNNYQRQAYQLREDELEERELLNALEHNLYQMQNHELKIFRWGNNPTRLDREYALFLDRVARFQQTWLELEDSYQYAEVEERDDELAIFEKLRADYPMVVQEYPQKLQQLTTELSAAHLTTTDRDTIQRLIVEFEQNTLDRHINDFQANLVKLAENIEQKIPEAKSALIASEQIRTLIIVISMTASISTATLLAFYTSRILLTTQQQEVRCQKRLSEELKKAKEIAEIANRAKSEFLSNMSHELRTPLNAILGYTQILQRDGNLELEQLEAINIIQQSGEHLLTLINDILDISKIEARKMQIEEQEIHFPNFLQSIASMMWMWALEKDILFECDFDPYLPQGVKADEKRLRQILLNLLSNAIKFTGTGKVTFKVDWGENKQTTDLSRNKAKSTFSPVTTIRFQIIDTGIGISKKQLANIFQPFEQISSSRSQACGTGLGLSISKQLVELMGGSLQVESQLDRGSNFWFAIPLSLIAVKPSMLEAKSKQIIRYQSENSAIWVKSAHSDNSLTNIVSLQSPMIPPPDKIALLYNFARLGNMRKIAELATELEQLAPQYLPLAVELKNLAHGFQEKKIMALVEECLQTSQASTKKNV